MCNSQNRQNMDKFFMVSFFGLLIAAHAVAGNMVYDNIAMLGEFENLDIEEENESELFEVPSWTSERGGKVLVNVDSFGAAGDGVSDDTQVHICVVTDFYFQNYVQFLNNTNDMIKYLLMWTSYFALFICWICLIVTSIKSFIFFFFYSCLLCSFFFVILFYFFGKLVHLLMLCYHHQAFVDAWNTACSTPKSVFLVPAGRRYLVNATRFKGPCADKLVVQVIFNRHQNRNTHLDYFLYLFHHSHHLLY